MRVSEYLTVYRVEGKMLILLRDHIKGVNILLQITSYILLSPSLLCRQYTDEPIHSHTYLHTHIYELTTLIYARTHARTRTNLDTYNNAYNQL